MAVSILSTLIKGLSEASKSELADATDLIVEGDVTKRTRLSTLAEWIRGKLGIGTASSLTTTSKELVGAINELNTKTKSKEMTAISAQGSNGWARYCIENGICFVNIELTPYSVEHDGPVCFPLPGAKYKNLLTFTLGTASGNCYCAYLRHTDNALCFYNPGYRTVERIDCTISYPVA